MGLTLLWVQAEVHVDSQEISCYLNSTIWTRYKPSRENCLLYWTLMYFSLLQLKKSRCRKIKFQQSDGKKDQRKNKWQQRIVRGSRPAGLVEKLRKADFGLLVSRTVGKQVCVVLNHCVCGNLLQEI